MLMDQAPPYRRIRAPQEDGQTLVDPPRSLLPDVVARNRRHAAEVHCDLQGRSLADVAAAARHGLIHEAAHYTRQYRDVPDDRLQPAASSAAPLLLSGHQPQLFHAGVWYKNFVLGGLAEAVEGVGVHLLIDSDLCRSASIRVPTGTLAEPRVESVPLDRPAAEMPYEERVVQDRATFRSFADRVTALVRPFVQEPVVDTLWPLVLERSSAETNLGLCLAQGRHRLEESWGNVTLELPQSAVCGLPEFRWFAAHLLAHLPRFWTAHNEALAEYRQAHRLRNRAQPVPDLAESDGWLEAPLWIWSADDPRRRPLFARQRGDELLLTDRRQRTFALELAADRDAALAVEQLTDLAAEGVRIRTRALATTLFARLALGDLFLHGIGGAKYDQVTDAIARRFFGFELPALATVSATLRLPIPRPRLDEAPVRTLERQLRELEYHPERSLTRDGSAPADETSAIEALVAAKRRWVNTPKTVQNARQRHQAISEANEALYPHVAHLRKQLEQELEEARHLARSDAILAAREYAFCLLPRKHLQPLLLDALRQKT